MSPVKILLLLVLVQANGAYAMTLSRPAAEPADSIAGNRRVRNVSANHETNKKYVPPVELEAAQPAITKSTVPAADPIAKPANSILPTEVTAAEANPPAAKPAVVQLAAQPLVAAQPQFVQPAVQPASFEAQGPVDLETYAKSGNTKGFLRVKLKGYNIRTSPDFSKKTKNNIESSTKSGDQFEIETIKPLHYGAAVQIHVGKKLRWIYVPYNKGDDFDFCPTGVCFQELSQSLQILDGSAEIQANTADCGPASTTVDGTLVPVGASSPADESDSAEAAAAPAAGNPLTLVTDPGMKVAKFLKNPIPGANIPAAPAVAAPAADAPAAAAQPAKAEEAVAENESSLQKVEHNFTVPPRRPSDEEWAAKKARLAEEAKAKEEELPSTKVEEDDAPEAEASSSDGGSSSGGKFKMSVTPAWEVAKGKTGAKWTQFMSEALEKYGKGLLKQETLKDAATYCPKYAKLSDSQRKEFWIHLFNGIAKYESNFTLGKPTYREPHTDADGTYHKGKQVFSGPINREWDSMGLFALTYKAEKWKSYPGCKGFKWSKDMNKKIEDSNLTIYDAKNQANCAVSIMNKWVQSDDQIGNRGSKGGARFWSTLRKTNANWKNVKAAVKRFKPCGIK